MNKKALRICFLIFLLLISIFVSKNQENIYSIMANHYYKKNDIQQAQIYFEKAFRLGRNNINDRELYVNSIINSPLTIQNQEKLVEFLKLNINFFLL